MRISASRRVLSDVHGEWSKIGALCAVTTSFPPPPPCACLADYVDFPTGPVASRMHVPKTRAALNPGKSVVQQVSLEAIICVDWRVCPLAENVKVLLPSRTVPAVRYQWGEE